MPNWIRYLILLFWLCAPGWVHAQAEDIQPEPPLLTAELPGKTIDQAYEALLRAIGQQNYTFVRDQAIDSRLVPQQWEAKNVRIVYFCNFAKMDRALSIDVRAAQFLPCRITLIETAKGVDLMAINPAWSSLSLGNPLLHPHCLELKRDYLAIMDEAAL
jgi:cytochrome c oxidase cbb3-type subunit 3